LSGFFAASGKVFLFVAGATDNGISSFEIAADGTLTNRANVDDGDDPDFELLGASALATTKIGSSHYLFAAGFGDDGISSFLVGSNGELTNISNVADRGDFELNGVASLATAKVGIKTFLFAAGSIDDGVSVFDVSNNSNLNNVFNVTDDATLNLNGAQSLTTAKIAGTTYLFVAARDEAVADGVSVFAVAADGSLVHMASVDDNDFANLEPDGASGLAVATVDTSAFLFVAGRDDDGISSFRIDVTGLTINGTAGNDVIDAFNAPAGELLPSELGDTIFGLAGNDTISGLDGDDILTGGRDKDILSGGAGADRFNFDIAIESARGANRDLILDFTHSQGDQIDLAGIDAKSGVGGNQRFTFIGKQGFHHEKGELHFVKKAGFVVVEGDINGDGRPDFQIEVHSAAALATGDFVL
jgi:Ca2+-binding RTX toxin-like protein